LEALERLSEQAGSRWMISLDEGCRSREEIVRRRRDPGIALDQIQQVQEMGLEVVQPGLRMVLLLDLDKRVRDACDPLLPHLGQRLVHDAASWLTNGPCSSAHARSDCGAALRVPALWQPNPSSAAPTCLD